MNGLPMRNISITGAILVVAFIAAGTVLAVTGHTDLANGAFGNVTGLLVGGTVVVTHVVRSNGNDNGNGKPPTFTT